MKNKTLILTLVAGILLFSCSSDDGGGTPVTPTPGTENAAPQIVSQTYSVFEDISDDEDFAAVTAIDADNDDLTFEIISNSNDLFKISDDGNLSLESGASLDYESATEHTITVSVSDGDKDASAEITITVNNIIENLFEDPDSFITTWETPVDGFELVIGTDAVMDYNFTIDWGDGSDEETFVDLAENPSHVYETGQTYTIAIKGTFPAIKMYQGLDDGLNDSRKALKGINQWGAIAWESFEDAFKDCSNLSEYSAQGAPDLSNVESLSGTFSGAIAFNGAIGNWNTTNIVDMSFMFFNAHAFNQDIGNWKTQNVTSMFAMFANLAENSTFNQDISAWDVSKVTNFLSMFNGAGTFDQNLGIWNISSAENMSTMFDNSGLSPQNFGATVKGWSELNELIPQNIQLGVENITFCESDPELTAATVVLQNNGWQFVDIGNPVSCD